MLQNSVVLVVEYESRIESTLHWRLLGIRKAPIAGLTGDARLPEAGQST